MNQNVKQNANLTTARPTRRSKWVRPVIQVFFFLLVGILSISKFLKESGIAIPFLSESSIHSICPFGGVASVYQFFTQGTFLQKIHESSFVLMVIVLLLTILFGPVFCGWLCPLGSIQEWVGKLGKRIFKKKFNRFIPYKVDRYLRFARYLVLALVLYKMAVTAKLLFQDVDPYYAMFNFFTGEVTIAALSILVVTLILSLFIERPWCKYACPYGALLGLSNLFRIFKIRRISSTCVNCGACDRACPMNIKISDCHAVRNHQCISCLKCTSEYSCPKSETVVFSTWEGNKK